MKATKEIRANNSDLQWRVMRITESEIDKAIRNEIRMRLDNAAIAKTVESEINRVLQEFGVNTLSNYAA